jgi:hypothetical protein
MRERGIALRFLKEDLTFTGEDTLTEVRVAISAATVMGIRPLSMRLIRCDSRHVLM